MKTVKSFLLAVAVGLSLTGAGTVSAFSFGDFSFSDDDWGPNWGDGPGWGDSYRGGRYGSPYNRPSRRGWDRPYRRDGYYKPWRRDRYYDYRGPAPGYYGRPPMHPIPAPEEMECPAPQQPGSN